VFPGKRYDFSERKRKSGRGRKNADEKGGAHREIWETLMLGIPKKEHGSRRGKGPLFSDKEQGHHGAPTSEKRY